MTKTIFLRINHKFIKQKDHIKYLGVIIDSHLEFKKHIHQLSTKISRSIGILAKLGHNFSVAVLKQLYFSPIYPFFIYSAIISSNTYLTTLQPLNCVAKEGSQNHHTFSEYTDHTCPLFKDLNATELIDRFTLETDNPSSKSVKIEGKPDKVRQILHPELRQSHFQI